MRPDARGLSLLLPCAIGWSPRELLCHGPRRLPARNSRQRVSTRAESSTPALRFASFDELRGALMTLSGDPLEAHGGRVVHFRGSQDAKLMVVGEAPGATEDELGIPYCGRSGKLLDQILTAAGFDPTADVYVSNLVKRRPPDNRDPTAQEIAWYKPFLLEELRLVDPAIVLCTGRHSMKALLGEQSGITKVRGQWYDQVGDGRLYMPVFHPSFLLRNPSREPGKPKSLTWVDFQTVRAKYDEIMSIRAGSADGGKGSDTDGVAEEWVEMDCP